jgi:hypothetical protein
VYKIVRKQSNEFLSKPIGEFSYPWAFFSHNVNESDRFVDSCLEWLGTQLAAFSLFLELSYNFIETGRTRVVQMLNTQISIVTYFTQLTRMSYDALTQMLIAQGNFRGDQVQMLYDNFTSRSLSEIITMFLEEGSATLLLNFLPSIR